MKETAALFGLLTREPVFRCTVWERAVKRIGRYLLDTKDKGVVYIPDITRGLECYVDAIFAGGWKDGNHGSPESVLSRTGFVIMYAGCPITWGSKL